MKLTIHHATHYRYAERVARSTQYIRLTPRDSARQRVIDWRVDLPSPAILLDDAFGNRTHLLTLSRAHDAIALVATGSVEIADVDDGEPADRLDPRIFLRTSELTEADEAVREFCEPMRRLVASRPVIGVSDLMAAIVERVSLLEGTSEGPVAAPEVLQNGSGKRQDRVDLFVACCRELGVPARFVSGYGCTATLSSVAGRAWAEVWLSQRWISFQAADPGQFDAGLVKLAVGIDARDAAPVRGVRLGGGEEALTASALVLNAEA